MPYNFTLPFRLSTGSGYFEVTEDILSAVASNIRSVLMTNWGERPMNYTFGCNLIEFLFEQRGDGLRRRIADRILSKIAEYVPYIDIVELNVLFSTDDVNVKENQMVIRLAFKLTEDPSKAGTIVQVLG